MKNRPWLSVMGHTKLVAVIGIIASVLILILMPALHWVAELTLVVVLVHIAIFLVLSLSVLVMLPEKIKTCLKIFFGKNEKKFDAGWSVGWMNGFWVVSAAFLAVAVLIYFSFANLQLLAFLLFLLSLNFFIGNLIIRSPEHTQYLTLPWVNLFDEGSPRILDAGCGAGRTTVALGKIYKGKITAFDMFDSDYIEGGGNTLLEKNLKLVGLTKKVEIIHGDITKTEFQDETFDAVVSSYMIDHLGDQKKNALNEINRILKPKGKMLMIVLTPNLSAFGLLNVLSFMVMSKKQWRILFTNSNFKLIEEGEVNGGTYFLIEK